MDDGVTRCVCGYGNDIIPDHTPPPIETQPGKLPRLLKIYIFGVCLANALIVVQNVHEKWEEIGSITGAVVVGITVYVFILSVTLLLFRKMIRDKNNSLRWLLIFLTFPVGLILMDVKTRRFILGLEETGGTAG